MTIIGFDTSKTELVGARIDKRALLKASFSLVNEPAAIAAWLDSTASQYAPLTVACEATADYHRELMKQCLDRAIAFKLINPILTKQFTRATIRKQKTDATDAWIIAKLALQGEGALATVDMLDPRISITRLAVKLQRMASLGMAVNARFRRIFPEEQEVATLLDRQACYLQESVDRIRTIITRRSDPGLLNLLYSLPGIGPALAPIFITEIRNIHRFTTAKSLAAYAGLDPKVKQSGLHLKHNTKLTKRGSPHLRRAAYIAAQIARQHDPELKTYFERKRAEGKYYKEAMAAVSRKLLYRIYAVWKRGTPYQMRNPQKLLT